ncbi:MAG: glutamine synthetase family protein [Rhodobacteraceae bacterium]|nr:glutamine synthetase family protein [Paracoccaceae bacterium]
MDLSQFTTLRVAACDLNGQMRGKRVPVDYACKIDQGAVRLPLSALNLDLWGSDIVDSPLVFASGDSDGVLRPTGRGPVPMPWIKTASALIPMQMFTDTGNPFAGDPRHALQAILDRYDARGWQVIAATEMEFTLVDASGDAPAAPHNPITGRALNTEAILALDELDAFDGFFSDLYQACADMGIPAQTATCEGGVGQFEMTLLHQDAMRAADDAWLFKTLTRGLARKHGMAATFMAKPFADDAGNGMHVHFSVLDGGGKNVFDNGSDEGSDILRQAVAGCLAAMPASTLIFAPFGNSYTRLVPGAHAPTGAVWAYENRTAAIRIPGGPTAARRIEHRVAGGDVNPYLMFSVILGAAITGIKDSMTPPAPITGNAYDIKDAPQLAHSWKQAIDLFANDAMIARILPDLLIRNLVMTKQQELHRFATLAPETHWLSYLEAV